MKQITHRKGDATAPSVDGNKIIAHVVNDVGRWGRGFVIAVSKRWPTVKEEFGAWYAKRDSNDFALGAVQLVQVEDDQWIANMVGQRGIRTSRSTGVPIRYDAVESCLASVTEEAIKLEASVHMPRIGCGLAGGTWEEIEPLIEKTLLAANVVVWVYDFG